MLKTKYPLILASQSRIRQSILENIKIPFVSISSKFNESVLKDHYNDDASYLSLHLAKEKAQAVSQNYKDSLIIASDQVLECDGTIYSKPKNKEDACQHLLSLQGKTHQLHSSVVLIRDGDILYQHQDKAFMTIYSFSKSWIQNYVEKAGEDILYCVGCYEYEGFGMQLFEKVEGDYYTILGFPVRSLIHFLYQKEYITWA